MTRDRYLTQGGPAAIDVVDIDGVERVIGHSALEGDSGGLVVSFGFDKARAFTEIKRRTLRGSVLIVVSTSLVLILTWSAARRFIRRPLGRLVDAANEWRLGEYARRVDIRDRSEIGQVADAFNTMADALERHERELRKEREKAEEAAARITMILESTADSVITVDRDFRITFYNERARVQIAEGRQLIGTKLQEAVFEPDDAEPCKLLAQAIEQQKPVSFETYRPHSVVWHEVNASPTSDGLAIFFRDITQHKRALEARRQTKERLHQSQKMESVGQLTGGVAHDFNNLLTVVSGNPELIEHTMDIGRVRKFAAAARRATDRGATLTTQLLAFSRQQKLSPKLVNANQLVRGFQDLIRQAVGEHCEIELRTDERLWLCNVDPSLLETALLNLALNGRDAMSGGGVLEIETENVVVDESGAGCPSGSYVRLSVRDTGCGMPREVRDRVFEPFFTTKEIGKGTGLGLSMVYGFVRQSGGHATVESAPGMGTTVALYLPKAAQTGNAEVEAVKAQAVPGGSERILVVEDNEDLLEVTSEMLTTFGYEVLCARDGAEAIRIVESGKAFDLLFSDIVMPNGISGVELARELVRRSMGVKILLTSGYAGDVLEHHQAAGEFPIIDKPFRRSDLVQRLQSILGECNDSRAKESQTSP
jgi:PAS domain S-box-containing protein